MVAAVYGVGSGAILDWLPVNQRYECRVVFPGIATQLRTGDESHDYKLFGTGAVRKSPRLFFLSELQREPKTNNLPSKTNY